MKTTAMRRLLALLLIPVFLYAQKCACVPAALPETFFGNMQAALGGSHNLTVPIGALRLWDTNCTWNFTETALNTYSFTNCDTWFDYAVSINAMPVFVMGRTPGWAIPGGTGACAGSYAPNGCALLTSDLNGANTILPNFVTALANHVESRYPGLKWAIEGLNEADLATECAGAVSGHCAMSDLVIYQEAVYQSAKTVDSTILVLGPAASTFNSSGPHLYGPIVGTDPCPGTGCAGSGFLKAGGGQWMDAANFHPYFTCTSPNFCQTPEAGSISTGLTQIDLTLKAFGLRSKPIAMSESDWGSTNTNNVLTDDQKTGYYLRELIYFWDFGVQYYWWYQWDCLSGNLSTCFGTWSVSGTPLPVVTAYATSRSWLLGSSHAVGGCNQNADGHGTWVCPLVLANGTPAEIVFNPSGNQSISVPGFSTQRNYDGTEAAISGPATAGLIPIMVQ